MVNCVSANVIRYAAGLENLVVIFSQSRNFAGRLVISVSQSTLGRGLMKMWPCDRNLAPFFKRLFFQKASKVSHPSEVNLENTIEGKNYIFATTMCLLGKTYMEVGCPYIFANNFRFVEQQICRVVGCPYNTILIHYCTVYAETTSVVP